MMINVGNKDLLYKINNIFGIAIVLFILSSVGCAPQSYDPTFPARIESVTIVQRGDSFMYHYTITPITPPKLVTSFTFTSTKSLNCGDIIDVSEATQVELPDQN